ncbi:hypothetical protein [Streptomyces sp. NPDC005336]
MPEITAAGLVGPALVLRFGTRRPARHHTGGGHCSGTRCAASPTAGSGR